MVRKTHVDDMKIKPSGPRGYHMMIPPALVARTGILSTEKTYRVVFEEIENKTPFAGLHPGFREDDRRPSAVA